MTVLATFSFLLAGFAALALSMQRHHRDLFATPPWRAHVFLLNCVGWTLLVLSFDACIAASGWAIGPVLWIGLLTVAALVIVPALTYGAGFVSGGGRPAPRKSTRAARHAGQNTSASAYSRSTACDTPRRTDGACRSTAPASRSGQASQFVSQPVRCT